MMIPKLKKVVVNMGIGKAVENKNRIEPRTRRNSGRSPASGRW